MDREELRPLAERGKDGGIGAGHERLRAELVEDGEEGETAGLIEMGGDLVEEDERRLAGEFCDQPRLGQDQADKERLLLAGGAGFGRHLLRLVADADVGEMRAGEGAAGRSIAAALVTEAGAVGVLDGADAAGRNRLLER